MDELLELHQGHPKLSLRRFARYVDVPYHKLRDHRKSAARRVDKEHQQRELKELVRTTALAHPTYGYRLLYQELQDHDSPIGLHRVRLALNSLGLSTAEPKKKRRPRLETPVPQDWPTGRRIQIDATRLSLSDGVCWVYFVLDIQSRVVLASRAVRSLSKYEAKLTLDEGVAVLHNLGFKEPIVVQSDGGSDFTSELFQQACKQYGSWIRSKVSQVGGMGILERLNRTYKYQFAFRHDWQSLPELRSALPTFMHWYNHQRRHSALSYNTPWHTLVSMAPPLFAA